MKYPELEESCRTAIRKEMSIQKECGSYDRTEQKNKTNTKNNDSM